MAWHRKPDSQQKTGSWKHQAAVRELPNKGWIQQRAAFGVYWELSGINLHSLPVFPSKHAWTHGSQRGLHPPQTGSWIQELLVSGKCSIIHHCFQFAFDLYLPTAREFLSTEVCSYFYSPTSLSWSCALLTTSVCKNKTKQQRDLVCFKHTNFTWWTKACFPLHHCIATGVKLHRAFTFVWADFETTGNDSSTRGREKLGLLVLSLPEKGKCYSWGKQGRGDLNEQNECN